MPFTISHAAASLPFLRRSKAVGWAPALVFGCMAPDLIFPIPYFGERHHTHSLEGLIALDIPFAVALAALWVFFLAERVSRLPGMASLGRPNPASFSIGMTVAGALVGCATHLFWDLFTHQGSPFLTNPVFARRLFEGQGGAISIQTVVWYANSLLGMFALGWWARYRLHSRGRGLRETFLSGAWLRIYAAFSLPYLVVIAMAFRKRPDHIGQVLINLVYLMDAVRAGMVVSLASVVALAWWETRRREEVRYE